MYFTIFTKYKISKYAKIKKSTIPHRLELGKSWQGVV